MNGNKLKSIVNKKKVWVGTHNSMTCYKPKCWWMKLFNIFSKCQRLPITCQIDSYDVIDLRISFDKKGDNIDFKHGVVVYNSPLDIYEILEYCQRFTKETKIVRIILEQIVNNRFDDCEDFIELCKYVEKKYTNVIFIGGRRKFDWYLLHDFNANKYFPDDKIYQHVSSMADDAKWYEKILPFLYAKRHNVNPNIHEEFKEGINLYDFVK